MDRFGPFLSGNKFFGTRKHSTCNMESVYSAYARMASVVHRLSHKALACGDTTNICLKKCLIKIEFNLVTERDLRVLSNTLRGPYQDARVYVSPKQHSSSGWFLFYTPFAFCYFIVQLICGH
jgi:hypothetical protein